MYAVRDTPVKAIDPERKKKERERIPVTGQSVHLCISQLDRNVRKGKWFRTVPKVPKTKDEEHDLRLAHTLAQLSSDHPQTKSNLARNPKNQKTNKRTNRKTTTYEATDYHSSVLERDNEDPHPSPPIPRPSVHRRRRRLTNTRSGSAIKTVRTLLLRPTNSQTQKNRGGGNGLIQNHIHPSPELKNDS